MGGLLGIIAAVISLLRAVPDIIRLIGAIIELIRQLKPGTDRKALVAEFREALEYAKRTKDTSKLDAFHQKLVAMCSGGACASGLEQLRNDAAAQDL